MTAPSCTEDKTLALLLGGGKGLLLGGKSLWSRSYAKKKKFRGTSLACKNFVYAFSSTKWVNGAQWLLGLSPHNSCHRVNGGCTGVQDSEESSFGPLPCDLMGRNGGRYRVHGMSGGPKHS